MDQEPQLAVVRGTPDAAELAALVAVLFSAASSVPPVSDNSLWIRSARPGFRTGVSPTAGPGAWRASGLPH